MIPLEKTYTVHLPFDRSKTKPVATLVIARDVDGAYMVGYALCNPKDAFNKQIGRQIAYGRLNKNPITYFSATTVGQVILGKISKIVKKRINFIGDTFKDLKTVFDTLDVRMKGK